MTRHYSEVLSPAWLPWATPAFQQAQRLRRPVLLLLDTAWASTCRFVRQEVLTVEPVAHRIAAAFVPVHVDADWRPDIADRYGLGAWPTLLALTPEGHVLGGGVGGHVDVSAWLDRTAALFAAHDGSLRRPPATPVATVAPPDLPVEHALAECLATLEQAIDPTGGTFGVAGQPVLAPALAALGCAAAGLPGDLVPVAAGTIDRVLASPRWDAHLGVLRCAGPTPFAVGEAFGRLEEQADWVRLLARAVSLEDRPAWRTGLEAGVAGLRQAFRHPSRPAWRPWSVPLPADEAGAASPPLFVDGVTRACRALCAAAETLEQPALASDAIAALEHVLPMAYARGAGVSHVLTERPHGPVLLADAMSAAQALLHAQLWRDQPVYRDLADELVRSARSRLTLADGTLADRRVTLAGASAVGRLADPLRPLEANADAARALVRLAEGDAGRLAEAAAILRGLHGEARAAGGFAAPVALAWAALLAPDRPISVW